MFSTSLRLEMRRPLTSTTGLSPPRPRSLRVSGASSLEQLGDRADAEGLDVLRRVLDLRLDIPDHRAVLLGVGLAGDDIDAGDARVLRVHGIVRLVLVRRLRRRARLRRRRWRGGRRRWRGGRCRLRHQRDRRSGCGQQGERKEEPGAGPQRHARHIDPCAWSADPDRPMPSLQICFAGEVCRARAWPGRTFRLPADLPLRYPCAGDAWRPIGRGT